MSANNPFMAGLQSIYGCGEWMIQFINEFAPDTDYAYMAFPSPDGGRENTTTFDGSVFTIPKGAKHPDASWKFITWLNKDENMTEIDYAFQNIPTKISVANSEKFMSDPKFKFNVDLYTGKNTFGPPKLPVTDTLFTKLAEAEGFCHPRREDSCAGVERRPNRGPGGTGLSLQSNLFYRKAGWSTALPSF